MTDEIVVIDSSATDLAVLPANPYPRPDRHPARVYLARLAPGSRPAQQNALELFVRAALGRGVPPLPRPRDRAYQNERDVWLEEFWRFPWHILRYQHVATIRASLITMRSPPYAHTLLNRVLIAMRRVLREARRLGLMSPADYDMTTDVERVHGSRLPAGEMIPPKDLQEIFALCGEISQPNLRARNMTVLMLLWGTGCRRAEVASARFEKYDAEKSTLTVVGKRNKERLVTLPLAMKKSIDAWIALRGTAIGPLLRQVSRGDRILVSKISPNTVGAVVKRVSDRFTPHDFRKTYISNAIDETGDLDAVANLVGHDDVNTTRGYDRRGERAMRRVSDGMKSPLDADADEFVAMAIADDEKTIAEAAAIESWRSYDFCKKIFTSSMDERRQFDDGFSGKRLIGLITTGKVSIDIRRFDRTTERVVRRGNESEEHALLKASTLLWLSKEFEPKLPIVSERSMSIGIPDLFMTTNNSVVWVECGDTETRKVLRALIAGYACLMVPYVSCATLAGIMLRVKPEYLAILREEEDRRLWDDHAGKGLL